MTEQLEPKMIANIVPLQRSQTDAAIATLAHAFMDDPLLRYFYAEDDQARLNTLQGQSKIIVRYSQPYNHIYTTADTLKGVAVWLPPGQFPLNNWRLLQLGFYAFLFKLRLSRLWQFLSLFTDMEEHHKQDISQPHWYLFMLGVAPAYQNQGIGGLLINPVLEQADREGQLCYLETSTERGVYFYQKHGFEIVRTGQPAENAPRFWTMKREPKN